MDFSNRIDTQRRTAVYVRISTSMQKTDRQVEELVTFAKDNRLNFNEKKDIYRDVISGFKDGDQRPMFSALMEKVRRGEYQQLLFSEFSRLDRKPSNLLRTLETLQKQNVYCWFNKQGIWVKDKNDIGTQIMIQVLAVLSQYEIELFAARGIDGKITALKILLFCGECGSRFCTALSTSGPTYKCAAKIKRGCTPRTCLFGADVQQSKLALLKFAEYDLGKEAKSKTLELQQEIDEYSKILEEYISKQTDADLTFNNYAKRVILVAKDDTEAADWIGKAREEHDRKTAEYVESIARIKTNLTALKRRRRSLTKLKEQSVCLRSDQISQDKNLLKEYVHEYIESIMLYKPSPLWVLVVVRFVDGSERWGTIKNVRYAKKEVKCDGEFKYTIGFSGWFINNDRHTLSYDKTAHTITEKQTDGRKTYTFEEYDAIVQGRRQTDFFEPYVFDIR